MQILQQAEDLGLPIFLNEAVYENYGKNKPDKDSKRTLVAQKHQDFRIIR
jgi:hypothetical protein